MFLRCERCRAVYEIDATPGQVVACRRCGHAFKAQAVSRVGYPGTIGGAAAENRASPDALPSGSLEPLDENDTLSWPEPVAKADDDEFAALVKGSKTPVIVVGLLVAGAAGAAAFNAMNTTASSAPPALPAQVLAEVDAAREALWRDDEASLEGALARFARAASLAPERPEPKAWQALATTLLGDTLACEVEELAAEAQWLEARLSTLADDAEPRPALEARHAAVGARLGVVEERARRLLAEGHELGLAAWSAAGMHQQLVTVRAMALIHAVAANVSEVDRLVSLLDEAQQADPWLVYARARAGSAAAVADGVIEQFNETLLPALERTPAFERARWQLGRMALLAGPEHLHQARLRFEQVLGVNDRHEGARRGLRRLETLLQDVRDADLAGIAANR